MNPNIELHPAIRLFCRTEDAEPVYSSGEDEDGFAVPVGLTSKVKVTPLVVTTRYEGEEPPDVVVGLDCAELGGAPPTAPADDALAADMLADAADAPAADALTKAAEIEDESTCGAAMPEEPEKPESAWACKVLQ